MTAWPTSLPQTFEKTSAKIMKIDPAVRTEMEYGPFKTRRRTTLSQNVFSGTMILSFSQYETLETFYDTTLDGGTGSFEFLHPFTGDTKTVLFASAIEYTPLGPNTIRASFSLRES